MKALKDEEISAKSYYEESQLDGESAQKRFALFKLLLNKEDRVALRYLLGAGTGTFRAGPYSRLRIYCENSGDTPWQALDKISAGTLSLNNISTLTRTFSSDDGRDDATGRPTDGRRCSTNDLHKSKGLSCPYVFIGGCVQGVLPQIPKEGAPKAEADADLEEARRLFFVGITRVKADPKNGRPGSLFLSYPKEMNAGIASGEKLAFKQVVYGQAQLLPSIFIQELGPVAPQPI